MGEGKYDASGINVLEPITARVRARPGLYLGSTDETGLMHLAWLCLDAAVVGYLPTTLDVRIDLEDGLIIRADIAQFDALLRDRLERGSITATGTPAEELVIASAVSRRFFIASTGEQPWSWSGRAGSPAADVVPPEPAPGLTIALAADPEIFPQTSFNREALRHRLRELAALYPRCMCRFYEETTGSLETVCFPHGLEAIVLELCGERGLLARPLSAEAVLGEVRVRVALRLVPARTKPEIKSWANTVRTRGGGAHVDGVLAAWRRANPGELGAIVGAVTVDASRTMLQYKGPTKDVLAVKGLDVRIADWLEPLLRAEVASLL